MIFYLVFILKKDTLKTKKGIFMYHFKFLILVILELIILDSYSITFLEAQLNARQVVDYDAVISRVMPFGCFVEIPELAVSGLVHVSLLSRRFLQFNESDQSLSAGGESWRAGDRLRVHVARVDFRERKVDFVPVREARPSKKRRKA